MHFWTSKADFTKLRTTINKIHNTEANGKGSVERVPKNEDKIMANTNGRNKWKTEEANVAVEKV